LGEELGRVQYQDDGCREGAEDTYDDEELYEGESR
jgi:hypothetical protein